MYRGVNGNIGSMANGVGQGSTLLKTKTGGCSAHVKIIVLL